MLLFLIKIKNKWVENNSKEIMISGKKRIKTHLDHKKIIIKDYNEKMKSQKD